MGVMSRKDELKLQRAIVSQAEKERAIRRAIEEIENSQEWKERMHARDRQIALDTFAKYIFFTCEYLELNFGCRKKALEKFITFAMRRLNDVLDDKHYFRDIDAYYKNEIGINILKTLGLGIEEDKAHVD